MKEDKALWKLLKPDNMILVFGLGLLLFLANLPVKKKPEENTSDNVNKVWEKENNEGNVYEEEQRKMLVDFLEKVDGVKEADALITYKGSIEKVMDNDRFSSPTVVKVLYPEVEGVVVTVKGNDMARIRKEITEAVCALFHLESNRVKVLKMSENT